MCKFQIMFLLDFHDSWNRSDALMINELISEPTQITTKTDFIWQMEVMYVYQNMRPIVLIKQQPIKVFAKITNTMNKKI